MSPKIKSKVANFVLVSVRFPGDLWKRIKAEASKKNLSVSDIVRLSVMDALPAEEAK